MCQMIAPLLRCRPLLTYPAHLPGDAQTPGVNSNSRDGDNIPSCPTPAGAASAPEQQTGSALRQTDKAAAWNRSSWRSLQRSSCVSRRDGWLFR